MPKADRLRISRPVVPSYDIDAANSLIDQAFDAHGWLATDADGEPRQEVEKLCHTLFTVFTTKHVVTSTAATSRQEFDKLVSEVAVTKYGLYIEMFPEGPGASSVPASDEEQAAKDHLADYLWRICTPTNRKNWLQRELGPSNLVVLETKVRPDDPSVPLQPGRYVTNANHAMLQFLDDKVFEDVRKKIAEADLWLATFYRRNPEIALPAAKKAKAALKSAVDAAVHANPVYVRESLALTAGDDDTSVAD